MTFVIVNLAHALADGHDVCQVNSNHISLSKELYRAELVSYLEVLYTMKLLGSHFLKLIERRVTNVAFLGFLWNQL